MVDRTIYEYFIRHDRGSNNTITPNNLHDHSLIFFLNFRHVLRLQYPQPIEITVASIGDEFTMTREFFFEYEFASTTTRRMLAATGVPPDFIDASAIEIISYVWQVAAEPCNSGVGILAFSLSILAVTPYDDRDVIERVLMESADQGFCTVPATKASIEALEEVKVTVTEKVEINDCRICLEEFGASYDASYRKIVRMPCSHLFHRDCIVKWLSTSHLCPLCRFALAC